MSLGLIGSTTHITAWEQGFLELVAHFSPVRSLVSSIFATYLPHTAQLGTVGHVGQRYYDNAWRFQGRHTMHHTWKRFDYRVHMHVELDRLS